MAFKNIVLIGTGGDTVGHYILQALVADGAFNLTVIARQSSMTTHPSSVKVIHVPNDFSHAALVQALRGQEVVILATGFYAESQQYKVVDAAVEAGVQRLIPSEWGVDNDDPTCQQLCPVFDGKDKLATYLRTKESATFSWTAVACSIWLEWALLRKVLDIDPFGHAVGYWHSGTHRFSCTTLAYVAQSVVQLLKNPEVGKNARIFSSAFETSQREIVAELERVQGVRYVDSTVDSVRDVEQAKERYKGGDAMGAYRLVTAAILLPEYQCGFVTAGKKPLLEEAVKMPKLTLRDVVQEVVEAQATEQTFGWK